MTPTATLWVLITICLFYLSTSFFLEKIGIMLGKGKPEHSNQTFRKKLTHLAYWLIPCIFLFAPLAMISIHLYLKNTLIIWLISILLLNKLYRQKLKTSILGGFVIAQILSLAFFVKEFF